jgi:hypothetical protein
MSRLFGQCGILDISHSYKASKACNKDNYFIYIFRCIVFIVQYVLYYLCRFVYSVLFERGVLFCVICVFVLSYCGTTVTG